MSDAQVFETVLDAIRNPSRYVASKSEPPHYAETRERWAARAVVAALGLDDFDAAVVLRERVAQALFQRWEDEGDEDAASNEYHVREQWEDLSEADRDHWRGWAACALTAAELRGRAVNAEARVADLDAAIQRHMDALPDGSWAEHDLALYDAFDTSPTQEASETIPEQGDSA